MISNKVRAIAICIFRREDAIFVFEGYDEIKGQTFYRPLGGTIEFGEPSARTVLRELREEINSGVNSLAYLGTLENIFTFNGHPGHEIVMVYQGDFADPALYDREPVMGKEDNGKQFKALWKELADFRSGKDPLYPEGLLQLLDQSG